MPISSNTLFHFTRDLRTLKSIFSFNFFPKLSLEDLSDITTVRKRVAFPMVCFCDIPLSQISEHVSKYGNYAIGLSKLWGILNELSPILYVHDNSSTAGAFRGIHNYFTQTSNRDAHLQESVIDFFHILPFIKPYETTVDNRVVRFYDEREWRFVPDLSLLIQKGIDNYFFVSEDDFLNDRLRSEINQKLESCPLVFTPDDIKYIIVSNEQERVAIYDHIVHTKRENFTYVSLQKLTTRILTIDQIREDF
jgi:hypothetical protein